MAQRTLSADERKTIFFALVQLQDTGVGVAASRDKVAKQFGVMQQQVERIEAEGVEADWPPWARRPPLAFLNRPLFASWARASPRRRTAVATRRG
jgi:hypothetical protein